MTRSITSRLREGNLFCQEAADHIEKLKTSLKNAKSNTIKQGITLTDMIRQKCDRIEKLEAALREIIDRAEHRIGHAVSDDVCAIARKALEGKDD